MLVLLVEDDPAVRAAFAKALSQAGFDVAVAGDAPAALSQLHKKPDALVCDFCLPGVDGSTFYHRVEETHPELAERVVFVTGWIGDKNTRNLLAHTTRPVLRKPVEVYDLINAVRAVSTQPARSE